MTYFTIEKYLLLANDLLYNDNGSQLKRDRWETMQMINMCSGKKEKQILCVVKRGKNILGVLKKDVM